MATATATTKPTPKLTPMMRQYLELKADHADAILFYRLGDFYEMFFEDAVVASRVLDLTLTSRNKNSDDAVPLCGIPYHSAAPYIQKLLEAGHKVAVCEQIEDPAAAKGIVERAVVRVVSPGTVLEEENLDPDAPNYLAAAIAVASGAGLAVVDLSTGELRAAAFPSAALLREELARLRPRELVMAAGAEGLETEGVVSTATIDEDLFDAERYAAWLRERGETESQGPAPGSSKVAERALGGLLAYLAKALAPTSHLRPPERYSLDTFLVLDENTRRNLELVETARGDRRGSLVWAIDRTKTPMGARTLRRWVLYPLLDRAEIARRHDAVQEIAERPDLRDPLQEALDGLGDLERLSARVASRAASPRDLLRVAAALRRADLVRLALAPASSDLIVAAREGVDAQDALATEIESAIVDEPPANARTGDVVRDGYRSEIDELRELRRDGKGWIARLEAEERKTTGIPSLKVRYNKVFGYFLEVTKSNLDRVPERFERKQTLAGAERFVTPELKEYEGRVLGAEERLRRLEAEIFEDLLERAALESARLRSTAEALGRLDVWAGLAEIAERDGWVRPTLDDTRLLELHEARHPVIERLLPAGRFVPNDLTLDSDGEQVMVLTGPNMAGKSTYLRQTGLLVLLAQMGSFVPAAAATIGLVDRIFTRVGASDNLAAGESTFMVEMKETAEILSNLTARSLVLLDEIGRGTSTFDGISIAWAVAEFLRDAPEQPKTLFATHFHELTELATGSGAGRVVNYSVAVKEWQGDVIFLRRIIRGPASQSYGIHVARLAGVPDAVVARAAEVLATLESGARADLDGSVRADREDQLPLFVAPSAAPSALVEEILAIDPLATSPLEALHHLVRIVDRAKGLR